MTSYRFHVAEYSGRFDRPTAATRRAVDRLRRSSSIVAGTEAFGRPRGWLRRRGWGVSHLRGVKAESWVTWRRRAWERAGKTRAPILSRLTWVRSAAYGGRRSKPTRALVVPLRHRKTGTRVFLISVHMPLSNTRLRAYIWTKCADGLVRLVTNLRRRHPGCKVIIVGDFNKNWRDPRDRALMANLADRLRVEINWGGRTPKRGGTHGNKILDYILTDLNILATGLPADDRSSDHSPLRARLEIP